jgi:hypothetical protein
MAADVIRTTVYIEGPLHQALRLEAAAMHRSVSELVNDAIRAALEPLGNGAIHEGADDDVVAARISVGPNPRGSRKVSAERLLEQWRHLPRVDPVRFRADVDSVIDSSL